MKKDSIYLFQTSLYSLPIWNSYKPYNSLIIKVEKVEMW